jgi:hypothetical protein
MAGVAGASNASGGSGGGHRDTAMRVNGDEVICGFFLSWGSLFGPFSTISGPIRRGMYRILFYHQLQNSPTLE